MPYCFHPKHMFNINTLACLRLFFIIVFSFNWFLNSAIGQNCNQNHLDSLKTTALNNAVNLKEKIMIYTDLAKCYLDINLDSTAHYAEKAKVLSTEIDYKKGVAVSILRMAQIEETQGNYDDALPLFNGVLLSYKGLNKDVVYLQAINSIGIIYEIRNDYEKSLEYYLLGLYEAEKQDHKLMKAFFYNNSSIIYNYTKFPTKEIENIKKASKIFQELGKENYYANSLVNIGAHYKSVNQFDSALFYLHKAEILQKKNNNYYGLTNLYANLGDISIKKEGNYEDALNYFNESLLNANLMDSLDPDRENRISSVNLDIGNALINLKKYSISKDHFYKTYSSGIFLGDLLHQKEGSYGLFLCFLGLDNNDSAIYYHNKFLAFNDSLVAEIYNEKIDKLNYEYALEKERELFEKDKELITLSKNRQELIYLIIVGILFTIAFLIFLIWYFQKTRLQKSELKRKNLQLEKENIANILDKKNRELTATVLNLIERNEFIAKLSERLQNNEDITGTDKPDSINDIIKTIDRDVANKLWKEFELRYMEVHKDFHHRLTTTYPTLTTNERKLCAFMVLNMSTKDISSITYQSEHSIKIARYRLRKKLGLSKNENLTSFLHNL